MSPAAPASSWYSTTPDAAAVPPRVAERALEWLVELQGAAPPEVIDEWARWRAAHPDHEQAWQRIESVRSKLQPLSAPVSSAVARAALAPAGSEQRRRVIKALSLLVFAGGIAGAVGEYSPWREWSADYRTEIGGRRSLTLSDGTQLVLNTHSAIDIHFNDVERRVHLIAGEALVITARDARPFLIETAQGTARALGTRYSVRQQVDNTEVSVFKGAVEIRPRHKPDQSIILEAGHRASYTAQAVTTPGPAQEAAIAWVDGFIVAHSMRLDDFIAELSRYTPASLSCSSGIAGLRVSGSFPLADISKVLDTLSATFGLQTETVTRFWSGRAIHIKPAPLTTRS